MLNLLPKKKKIFFILLGIVVIFVLVGLVYWIFFVRQASFTGERFDFNLSGTESVQCGKKVYLTVNYTNHERVNLKEVEVSLLYPDGFIFESAYPKSSSFTENNWKFEQINPDQEGKIEISGILLGEPEKKKTFLASVTYRPENVSSKFVLEKRHEVTIKPLDVLFSLDLSPSVQIDQEMEIPLIIANSSLEKIANLRVQAEYPEEFEVISTSPATKERNNIWDIFTLDKGEKYKIKIKGKFSGEIGKEIIFKTNIGLLDDKSNYYKQKEIEAKSTLVQIQVRLTLEVEGLKENNIDPGSTLNYKLHFKNEGSEALKNIVVSCVIDSLFVVENNIFVDGGRLEDKKAIWDRTTVPVFERLEPGIEGDLRFKVKLKPGVVIKEEKDKNFTVKTKAKIEADVLDGQKISKETDELEIKINTQISLTSEARYYDFEGMPVGSGPLPPKVGQTTKYRIYLLLSNKTNDIEGGRVEVNLAPGVSWTGVTFTSSGNLTVSGTQAIWDIGNIPANAGQLTSNLEAYFELSITPDATQIGKTVKLIEGATFSGKDSFTAKYLEAKNFSQDTNLENDFLARGKGKVEE